MAFKGWEDVTEEQLRRKTHLRDDVRDERAGPAPRVAPKAGAPPGRLDRGRRRGAHRVIVTADRQVVDHQLAKNTGTKGTFFQSRREALRWVDLLNKQDQGIVQGLRRQVKFELQCKNAAGLTETVTRYTADFHYQEREQTPSGPTWRWVVEDVKPRGGLREDTYILKKKWFEAQYGIPITETH